MKISPVFMVTMKLELLTDEELKKHAENLEFDSRRMIDKHKRWEAEQKLKLIRAEMQRRKKENPLDGIFRQVKRWFEN